MARRDRPPIQRCLRRGDELIVQIIKEGIVTKGPTLSTYVSIPGRILVMMPGMGKFGVSRKIEDEDERRRLRTILDSLKPLKDVGFIIRTAGIGKTKTDIQRDLTYLTRLWQTIEKKIKSGPGPMELYTEGDLVTRTVRDVFSPDVERIIVDNKDVAKRVKDVIKITAPRTKNKVDLYEDRIPLFHKYGMEREIELMYSRHVPLPSGGSLVIDSTEAIVAIDVNSGKFRDHSDAEMTAFKTDMEAADEIPRQLRLRDLGGVIICDFIDLRYERHRRDLEKKLHDNLRNDRAKTKVLRMSQFGIIEMTRQRMRPSLKRSIYFDCPHCHGSGLVKTPESMSLDAMRKLAIAIHDQRVQRAELTVCPDVAFYLLNRKRERLTELEHDVKKTVLVRQDPKMALDDLRLDLFDQRDGLVFIEALGMTPFAPSGVAGGDDSRRRGAPQGRRDQRGGGGRHQQGRHQPVRQIPGQQRDSRKGGGGGVGQPSRDGDREVQRERDDDRFDIEHVEDAIDDREVTRVLADERLEPASPELPREDDTIAPAPDAIEEQPDDASDDDADESAPSQVIDVDDPVEPMGEGPREMQIDQRGGQEDGQGGRRRRRRRGRRGRGRGRGQQPQQGQGAETDEDRPS
jgi:Rne/Rng family ribonuclease